MKALVDKYAKKLVAAGLAEEGAPLVGGLDAELVWNRHDRACAELEQVLGALSINALLFSEPAEPYRSIIEYLAGRTTAVIRPRDCETRTFFHDLPVVPAFEAARIAGALKQRKSVIIPGHGIVTWGAVSPEQAFISYSSVCFSCFVKFFFDYLADSRRGALCPDQRRVFEAALPRLAPLPEGPPALSRGPFTSAAAVYDAICEAGRLTVAHHLVDSYFGNISYLYRDTLYISQTSSSLDELEGCVDPCPLDGSSCTAITASSEFSAHREVAGRTGMKAILHGHPKFAVILSMDCTKQPCDFAGQCHITCPEARSVGEFPIVSGEVGTGPHGLCHTVPAAIEGRRGVIVYGHGVFSVGRHDFNEAFANLVAAERRCRETYFDLVQGLA